MKTTTTDKLMRIKVSSETYEAAKAAAKEAGFTCVGTKVSHDINQMYARRAKRIARKAR